MNFRLQQFLAAENISQAQFADAVGVARASVSHILAGRNKPGFDFISNMARAYPELNLEWLISGKGRMYKDGHAASAPTSYPPEEQFFAPLPSPSDPDNPRSLPDPEPEGDSTPVPANDSNKEVVVNKQTKPNQPTASLQSKQRRIARVIVFYDDNTYQELPSE